MAQHIRKGTGIMTNRQLDILAYLKRYIVQHGFAPTYREIGDNTGCRSSSVVAYNLQALERAGHITREPGKPRTIKLTNPPKTVGAVAAEDLFCVVTEIAGILGIDDSTPDLCRVTIRETRRVVDALADIRKQGNTWHAISLNLNSAIHQQRWKKLVSIARNARYNSDVK